MKPRLNIVNTLLLAAAPLLTACGSLKPKNTPAAITIEQAAQIAGVTPDRLMACPSVRGARPLHISKKPNCHLARKHTPRGHKRTQVFIILKPQTAPEPTPQHLPENPQPQTPLKLKSPTGTDCTSEYSDLIRTGRLPHPAHPCTRFLQNRQNSSPILKQFWTG